MEMVGALWETAAGTVCASWAGGAADVTPQWKLPAVTSRTTMEVGISTSTTSYKLWYTQGYRGQIWEYNKPALWFPGSVVLCTVEDKNSNPSEDKSIVYEIFIYDFFNPNNLTSFLGIHLVQKQEYFFSHLNAWTKWHVFCMLCHVYPIIPCPPTYCNVALIHSRYTFDFAHTAVKCFFLFVFAKASQARNSTSTPRMHLHRHQLLVRPWLLQTSFNEPRAVNKCTAVKPTDTIVRMIVRHSNDHSPTL